MCHTYINVSKLKNVSHVEMCATFKKCVTERQMCHSKKISHLKNVLQVEKCVTLRKIVSQLKQFVTNPNFFKECVTFRKICHIRKNLSRLEKVCRS